MASSFSFMHCQTLRAPFVMSTCLLAAATNNRTTKSYRFLGTKTLLTMLGRLAPCLATKFMVMECFL